MQKFLKTVVLSCVAAVLSLGMSLSVQAATVDMTDPYKMVTAVADTTFSKIKANKDTYHGHALIVAKRLSSLLMCDS